MAEKQHFFHDADEWAQQVVSRYAELPGKTGLLLLDIDDTVLDANLRWYERYIELAKQRGLKEDECVTIEEFAVSPRAWLTPLVDDYSLLKTELMIDEAFNAGMKPVESSPSLQEAAKDHDLPHGYITTRTIALGNITCQNLLECNYFQAPVLLRAEHISYSDTIGFKLGALATMKAMLKEKGLGERETYYVDDYKQLITELNDSTLGITGIHFQPHISWDGIVRQCLAGAGEN